MEGASYSRSACFPTMLSKESRFDTALALDGIDGAKALLNREIL